MPFGLGGGPWWLYGQDYQVRRPSWRCFRHPWLPRWWWARSNYSYSPPTEKEEVKSLKSEARVLKEELAAVNERIAQLEAKQD